MEVFEWRVVRFIVEIPDLIRLEHLSLMVQFTKHPAKIFPLLRSDLCGLQDESASMLSAASPIRRVTE